MRTFHYDSLKCTDNGILFKFEAEDPVEADFWKVLEILVGKSVSVKDLYSKLDRLLHENVYYPTRGSYLVQQKILKVLGGSKYFFDHIEIFAEHSENLIKATLSKDLDDFVFGYTNMFRFSVPFSNIIEYEDKKINDFEYKRIISDNSAKRLLIVFFFDFVSNLMETSNLFKDFRNQKHD